MLMSCAAVLRKLYCPKMKRLIINVINTILKMNVSNEHLVGVSGRKT